MKLKLYEMAVAGLTQSVTLPKEEKSWRDTSNIDMHDDDSRLSVADSPASRPRSRLASPLPDDDEASDSSLQSPPQSTAGVFCCHICSFVGHAEEDFKQHMLTHYNHACPQCDYTSRTEGRLRRHIREFHSPLANKRGTGQPKLFRCRQCSFVANDKVAFWEHSACHMKRERILRCPNCPFLTEYKHHLEYHLRNHAGSKPFQCTKCNYSCVNKSMLNSHMKSHTNIYQYRCADCAFASKYCHSLRLHLEKTSHHAATVLNPDGSLPTDGSGNFSRAIKRGAHYRASRQQQQGEGRRMTMPALSAHNASLLTSDFFRRQFRSGSFGSYLQAPVFSPMSYHSSDSNDSFSDATSFNSVSLSLPPLLTMLDVSNSLPGFRTNATSLSSSDALLKHSPHKIDSEDHKDVQNENKGWQYYAPSSLSFESSFFNPFQKFDVLYEQRFQPIPRPVFPQKEIVSSPPNPNLNTVGWSLGNDDSFPLKDLSSEPQASQVSMATTFENSLAADKVGTPLDLSVHGSSSCQTPASSPHLSPLHLATPPLVIDSDDVKAEDSSHVTEAEAEGRKNRRKGRAHKIDVTAMNTDLHTDLAASQTWLQAEPAATQAVDQSSIAMTEATANDIQAQDNTRGFYECQHCLLSFKDYVMFVLHRGYHGYRDPFKCNLCGKNSNNRIEFFLHIAQAAHA